MALKRPHVDESTDATYPEAYWRVVEIALKPTQHAAVIAIQMYASQAARDAGKQPLHGVDEVWVRNTTERVRRNIDTPKPAEGEPPQAPPPGVFMDLDGWFIQVDAPRNDYDEWFGPEALAAEGVEPIGQAYRYIMAQPEWADAKDS